MSARCKASTPPVAAGVFLLPEGGTTSSAACVRRLPQRGRQEKGRGFARSLWGKTSVYRHGKTSVYRYARSLILWGFYAGRGGDLIRLRCAQPPSPKGKARLSKNPWRAREGQSPLEFQSCPAACTVGTGGFLRRKIPFSRAKIVSLQFLRPEI